MNRSILLGGAIAGVVLVAGLGLWLASGPDAPPAAPGTARQAAVPGPAQPPAPDAPPAVAARGPAFDVVRVERDGTAVLAGRAEPGAEVTVFDGERELGTVRADSRGEWVLLPDAPLAPGARELRVEQQTEEGAAVAGADPVILVVPERQRDIAGRPEQGTGGALALVAPAQGAARVLQAPPAPGAQDEAPLPAGSVAVDTISYDREGRVSIGGRAEAGAEVMVYLDNTLAGRATADAQGRWELTPDRPVEEGRRSLRVDRIRGDGQVSARAEVPFERRGIDEGALGGRAVVVLPGNNLWTIARRSIGQGPNYTLIFQANQGQIRDPNMIYPGQIFIIPGQSAER